MGITDWMPGEELILILNSIEDYDERHEILEAYLMVTGAEYHRLEPGDHASFASTSLHSMYLSSCKLISYMQGFDQGAQRMKQERETRLTKTL